MKALLRLEFIGYESEMELKKFSDQESKATGCKKYKPSLPWVAELTCKHERFKFGREFVRADMDFIDSSNSGNRGVFGSFIISSDAIYEVFERISWKSSRRFFCTVDKKGNVKEINEDQVVTVLSHKEIDNMVKNELKN